MSVRGRSFRIENDEAVLDSMDAASGILGNGRLSGSMRQALATAWYDLRRSILTKWYNTDEDFSTTSQLLVSFELYLEAVLVCGEE